MKNYIALLRGINVSGQKKIKMAELKESLEKNGFPQVRTYIQSGNMVFKSEVSSNAQLQNRLQEIILKDFGFKVPTLVMSGQALESIMNANPFSKETEKKGLYFVLLKEPADPGLVDEFNKISYENEDFHITDSCVYLNCKAGYGKAKLNNNLIEQKLKVEATTRNLKTVQKLIEMTKEI